VWRQKDPVVDQTVLRNLVKAFAGDLAQAFPGPRANEA
jgi:hypothetical protein